MTARIVPLAVLGLLAATSANADGRGGGGSSGDSWLRSELQNPVFVQPYGYLSPNYTEYRPFYGYGYPYTPCALPSCPDAPPRAVIRVKRHGY